MSKFKQFIAPTEKIFTIDQATIEPHDVDAYHGNGVFKPCFGDYSIPMRAEKVQKEKFADFLRQQREENKARFISEFIAWYKEARHKETHTPERINSEALYAFRCEKEGDNGVIEFFSEEYDTWVKVVSTVKGRRVRAEFYRKNADAMLAFYNEHCTYADDDMFLENLLLECEYPTTTI